MNEDNYTLAEFANRRRSQGRQVSVFVKGDPKHDPPKGRATACRVADVLQSDEGSVIDVNQDSVDPDSLAKGSVLLFTVPSHEDDDAWDELAKISDVVYPYGIHVVVHTDELPEYVLKQMDVRVVDDGGLESIGRLQVDSYGGQIYEVEMNGLL
jgi:hypothetical protein